EPLEERERRRRVVAHAVEAVGERQIGSRPLPALPAQTRGFERSPKRPRSEVEEVLARLVVVPEPAERSRLQSADVRRDEVHDAAGNEQAPHRGERGDRIGEVLDRVVERDDVETGRRKSELLETARGHAQAASASLLGREAGYLGTLDVPP